MNRFDLSTFRREVDHAARQAFTLIAEKHPDQTFCGYALYSDEGAMTVCCAANTTEHLARMQQADPGDAEYYAWSPAEWAVENGVDSFTHISSQLAGMVLAPGGVDDFAKFRDDVFDTCVNVLETLVAEGFFPPGHDHVVVFAVSDFSDPTREISWIRRLNPALTADRFARMIDAADRG